MTAKTMKKQADEDYHLACQHCGTFDKPLHMIPLRNEKNVVGIIIGCDDCGGLLAGQTFDLIK